MHLKEKLTRILNNQIIRYIFSGGTATFVNLVVLYGLVQFFHLWYLTSAIIAFCFSAVVSFVLQKFFTFRDGSKKGMHLQFSIFFFYVLAMLGVNTLLMYLFVDIWGFWYFLSQIIISIIIAFLNYNFFNKIVFRW